MRIVAAITSAIAVIALLLFCGTARANEGTGTADFCERHGCGAPTTDSGPVTGCPDPTPPTVCPDVTCQATDCAKTTVIVNPTPCPAPPAVTFPRYYPCRQTRKGTFVCPRKATPHRVFLPETDAASGK